MKNPLLLHPRKKGLTYRAHFKIAASVGLRLLLASSAFGVHALLPFIPIPKNLNLTNISKYLREVNAEITISNLNR